MMNNRFLCPCNEHVFLRKKPLVKSLRSLWVTLKEQYSYNGRKLPVPGNCMKYQINSGAYWKSMNILKSIKKCIFFDSWMNAEIYTLKNLLFCIASVKFIVNSELWINNVSLDGGSGELQYQNTEYKMFMIFRRHPVDPVDRLH